MTITEFKRFVGHTKLYMAGKGLEIYQAINEVLGEKYSEDYLLEEFERMPFLHIVDEDFTLVFHNCMQTFVEGKELEITADSLSLWLEETTPDLLDLNTYIPTGDIRLLTRDMVEFLLKEQVEQGAAPNPYVFEGLKFIGREDGGIDWGSSKHLSILISMLKDNDYEEFYLHWLKGKEFPRKMRVWCEGYSRETSTVQEVLGYVKGERSGFYTKIDGSFVLYNHAESLEFADIASYEKEE